MMNEQVRTIMSTNVPIVHPKDSICQVTELMKEKNYQLVYVVEFGKFLGIFSLIDLWKIREEEPGIQPKTVAEVMNKRVVKIAPVDKIGTAAELFVGKQFKILPVVNLRNELKGSITAFDIIRYAMNLEYRIPILFEDAFTVRAKTA